VKYPCFCSSVCVSVTPSPEDPLVSTGMMRAEVTRGRDTKKSARRDFFIYTLEYSNQVVGGVGKRYGI
jgi:hypothetical protein